MKLHPYQRVAVDHLQRNTHAGCFLDMGLGKTAVTLAALTADHLPVLVIAPKRVAEHVWPVEAQLWRPDLRLRPCIGRKDQRLDALRSPADIHVVTRDNLADLTSGPWRTLVLDELSSFKSPRTQRFKTMRKRRDHFQHVWGLTGTPSPNGLLDLWSQLYLLDGGQRLGRTLTGYRNRYFTPGRQLASGVIVGWDLRPEAEERIHEAIDDICISMTGEGRIRLPPVTTNTVTVPLSAAVRRLYERLKKDLVVDLDVLGGQVHTAANAAVLSGKLAQVTAGFLYSDDGLGYTRLHTEKVTALTEIIEGTGSPVLVFHRFRAEAAMIREALPGAASIDDDNVIERWNAGKVPVLLAHPASTGHGLNLQHGGHTIVWTTLPWSLEEWEQSNARLVRQGQDKPVVIHVLSSPRTIDGEIHRALTDKTRVQDALMRHLESAI